MSTLEEQIPETLVDDDWAAQFAQKVDEQRDRMRELLRAKRKSAREVESTLARQIQAIHDQLAEACTSVDRREAELSSRESEVEHLEDQTRRQRKDAARRLRAQRTEVLAEIELQRAEAVRMATDNDAELKQQIADAARQAQQQSAELAARQQQCAQLEEQLDEVRAENERLQEKLARQNTDDAGAAEELREQAAQLSSVKQELAELKEQLAEREAEIADANKESARLQSQLEEASAQAREHAGGDSETAAKLERLRVENEELAERLTDAEARAERAGESGGGSEEADELRERLEMAMEDLRETKAANEELNKSLASAKSAVGSVGGFAAAGDGLDWESQKQRMLAQLESDFDEGDEQEGQDKLTVEGAIQITDQVVAEKEKEVEELKRLLEEQSGNIGDVAVGAAAIAAALDQDELIVQERVNLKEMQNEWREKLKVAEVDISMERAKLGRERSELEEKIRLYEDKLAQFESAMPADADACGGKPAKGRWLARLGLKGDDE